MTTDPRGFIRTYVPLLWAAAISWLNEQQDVVEIVPTGTSDEVVLGAVFVAWYGAGRWLERRWPAAGRWMLGSQTAPTYTPTQEA